MADAAFDYRRSQAEQQAKIDEQAAMMAEAQRQYNAYANPQRGTMRPKSNDPDAGVQGHGDAIEMIYDEFEGAWVEQRKLSKP